jgi:nucleoside phosphorylase
LRILVTFAVEAEFAPWRKLRSFARQHADGLDLWKTTLSECDLFVLLTGIGKQSGAHAMDLLMRFANSEKYFDVCISSGMAGALHLQYKVGEVLVAKFLRTDAIHADLQSDSILSDPELMELAANNGAKRVEAFYTTERVATTVIEKSQLASLADAVDMESFGIVKEGITWGARGIAVRAISDGADADLPLDFNRTINSSNQVSIPRVLIELVKRPSALPGLIEFGKQSRKAAESLAHFLESYVIRIAQAADRKTNKKVAVS